MVHPSLPPLIESVQFALLPVAGYEMHLDLRFGRGEFHGSALGFSKSCQFESEVSPPPIQHLLKKLLNPISYNAYLNFPLIFSRRTIAYVIFLNRILMIFMIKRFANIWRGEPFIFRFTPISFAFWMDLTISLFVSFLVSFSSGITVNFFREYCSANFFNCLA